MHMRAAPRARPHPRARNAYKRHYWLFTARTGRRVATVHDDTGIHARLNVHGRQYRHDREGLNGCGAFKVAHGHACKTPGIPDLDVSREFQHEKKGSFFPKTYTILLPERINIPFFELFLIFVVFFS
jgi:hypothetical protein